MTGKKLKRHRIDNEVDLCQVNFDGKEKDFDDRLLSTFFDNLHIRAEVVDCLKTHFNLHHATAPQVASICSFSPFRSSLLLQSHTGTGKTLAFLIPLAERMLQMNKTFIEKHSKPYRSTCVHAIIISPHQELSRQTFVQCSKLFAHLPYDVRVVQGVEFFASNLENTNQRGKSAERSRFRGGGIVLTLTPHEYRKLDEVNLQHHFLPTGDGVQPTVGELNHVPLTLIIDEVDLVCNKYPYVVSTTRSIHEKIQKINAEFEFDYGFFGATASRSPKVREFMQLLSANFCHQDFLIKECANQTEVYERDEQALPCVSISETVNALLPNMQCMLTCEDKGEKENAPRYWNTFEFEDKAIATSSLKNLYVDVESDNLTQQVSLLAHILNAHQTKKHIVYFDDYRRAKLVYDKLVVFCNQRILADDVDSIYLFYPDMPISQRNKSYLSFVKKKDSISERSILLCTDHLAHGINIRDVGYVVHFDKPRTTQSYLHRVGRTGRMGTRGASVIFLDVEANAELFQQLHAALPLEEWKIHNPLMIYL